MIWQNSPEGYFLEPGSSGITERACQAGNVQIARTYDPPRLSVSAVKSAISNFPGQLFRWSERELHKSKHYNRKRSNTRVNKCSGQRNADLQTALRCARVLCKRGDIAQTKIREWYDIADLLPFADRLPLHKDSSAPRFIRHEQWKSLCGYSRAAASAARRSTLVNPGDSMPKKFTNPATPCSRGP